jgi:hypothetical protein
MCWIKFLGLSVVLLALMVFAPSCENKERNEPRAETKYAVSVESLAKNIFNHFLQKDYTGIISYMYPKPADPFMISAMEQIMEFVRSASEDDFSVEVVDWDPEGHGSFLPGLINNRKLVYNKQPEGLILIKWNSSDGKSSRSLHLPFFYKSEKGYLLSGPSYDH